jgi:outer membrane protein
VDVPFPVWQRILIYFTNIKITEVAAVKKYLFLFTVILFAGLVPAQAQKIGYVDSQIILQQLPEAIKAQGDLDAIYSQWKAQLDSMTQIFQQGLADYQKQMNTMPEDKRKTVEAELVQKRQVAEEYNAKKFQQPSGEFFKRQEEIFTPIKEKIYKAIGEVAKAEGYQYIFDKSTDTIILFADPAFDMTYRVMDKLKRG